MPRPLCRLLLVALLLPGGFAARDAGAVTTGSIGLSGTIDANCYVVITDQNRSLNLVGGSTNLTVARVGERCNDRRGYTVTFSSLNGGAVVNADGTRVAYTIRYDGQTRALTSPYVRTRTSAQTSLRTRDFQVTVPANTRAVAGTYADTITVTIAAR